jgi:hypothetical protein
MCILDTCVRNPKRSVLHKTCLHVSHSCCAWILGQLSAVETHLQEGHGINLEKQKKKNIADNSRPIATYYLLKQCVFLDIFLHLLVWLLITDYVDGVRHLRTAATNGLIVHPPGDMWAWRAIVMMIPAGENSWLIHQSYLAVLPAETCGSKQGKWMKEWAFCI